MLSLHSLSMTRFRGIREGQLTGLTDVNLLIGRNNSGKTTVFEAVMRVLVGPSIQDLLGRGITQIWSQIRQVNGDFGAETWYRQDTSGPIVLRAWLGDDKKHPREKDLTRTLQVKMGRGNANAEPSHAAAEGGTAPAQDSAFTNGVILFRPLDALNRTIESRFWPQLLSNRRDKMLTATLNRVFNLNAESFQLLPDNRLMVLFEEYSLPLDVQGDGTRTALRALMVLTMMKGTLLLLEEPECHQHPGSLERFAQALCTLARENEVQLMISTHSAECVRSFLKAAGAVKANAAVFHLTLEDGKQEARRLDPEAVETLQTTGVDVRFLDLYA